MELYYHITHINKKKCVFNFNLLKSSSECISGNAAVNLKKYGRDAVFDLSSGMILSWEEKEYIISSVLKHIC